MTVKSEVVKAEKGKPGKIIYDRKRITEKDFVDKVCLYSKFNGALKIDAKGFLSVANHMVVDNVNYSTGNINFDGSVTINGTIEDGFSVIATEDIEIKGLRGIGCIKEIISTGGNVLIGGGINGRDKSTIKAKNIASKYISNAIICAESTVNVRHYILNSIV